MKLLSQYALQPLISTREPDICTIADIGADIGANNIFYNLSPRFNNQPVTPFLQNGNLTLPTLPQHLPPPLRFPTPVPSRLRLLRPLLFVPHSTPSQRLQYSSKSPPLRYRAYSMVC